jgi:hypothetical protein
MQQVVSTHGAQFRDKSRVIGLLCCIQGQFQLAGFGNVVLPSLIVVRACLRVSAFLILAACCMKQVIGFPFCTACDAMCIVDMEWRNHHCSRT